MWRQGDILIERVTSIPEGLEVRRPLILSSSHTTGHTHRIKDRRSARLYSRDRRPDEDLFLEVLRETADVVHPEHGTISLPRGSYRVWRQREFTEQGPVRVYD